MNRAINSGGEIHLEEVVDTDEEIPTLVSDDLIWDLNWEPEQDN